MKCRVETKCLVPAARICGANSDETKELKKMFREASQYLRSFTWCESIVRGYFGLGVGGIVAVFLFKIVPASKEADEWLWVITGDLPPAYITIDDAPNAACALDGYIYEMRKWVRAVKGGRSVENLIPVNAAPTQENAHLLAERLNFLRKKLLSYYTRELAACRGGEPRK